MQRDYTSMIGNQFAKGNKPNKTSFRKGQVPWNKGLKGIHLSSKSEFKKGHENVRTLEVGSLTIRKCEHGKRRQFIKIAEPNKWEVYAIYLWKAKYGGLRRGDVIHHINGNVLDDRIENLIALPRSDHPRFHSMWGLHPLDQKQINYYHARYKGQLEFLKSSPPHFSQVGRPGA